MKFSCAEGPLAHNQLIKQSKQPFHCFHPSFLSRSGRRKEWMKPIPLTALALGAPFNQPNHSPLIVFLHSLHSFIIPINSRSDLLISLSLLGGWFVSLRWLLFGGAHGGQPPITAAGSESSKANQPRSSAPQIKIKLFYFSLWAPFAPPQEWNHSLRSFIHSLGPLTPQHTSFQSFFPLGREEWNEMKVLLMARGVIIAGINQLSFIIQNKVFHYCRQQVYSCSNNCTVIISF